MTVDAHIALLTTVNAPYQTYLDGSALAAALKSGEITSGQVNSFFMETSPADQKAFADDYGISVSAMATTAASFAKWSGQKLPSLA